MTSLQDERDIIALLTRYATGIDRRDWTLFRSCFAENFTGDYPGFGLWHGPDEITAFMEQAHAPLGATLHRLSNFVIEAAGQGAVARSYVDALLLPGSPEGAVHQAAGWYDDELIRTGEGWKILRRVFAPVRII